MRKIIITALLVLSMPIFQGCAIGILAAGVGYAVGQGRRGTAAQMEAKSKFLDRYNAYKLGMENINLEREKANLKTEPVDDFETWLNQQPLTPEEQKLFMKSNAQTPNEIKQEEDKKEEAPKTVPSDTPQTTNNFKG